MVLQTEYFNSERLSKFQYFLKVCVTKLSSNYSSCHMLISGRWAHFFQQMSLKGNEIFCNNIYTYRYIYENPMSYKGLISPNIHLLDVIYNKCSTYQHKWEEKSKSYKSFFFKFRIVFT